jgi:Flp pilus assembly protein TadG
VAAIRPGGGQRGAAAVEFAIVLPLLVVILFGIVEFSVIMYDKALITSASREGARFGAVFHPTADKPSCQDVYDTAVQPYEQSLVTFGGSTTIAHFCFQDGAAVPSGPVCTGSGERQFAVETVFTYSFLVIPNFVTTITGPLTMRSTTVMRCE